MTLAMTPPMARSLLAASWFAVRRPGLVVPAAAAALLVLLTLPGHDAHGVQVLRGVGVLLACACAATTDDPSGEVAAGSPYSRMVRTLARVLAGLAVLVPVWLFAAALVWLRLPWAPVAGLALEAAALCCAAIAIGTALRAWTGRLAPSYLAVMGVLGVALLTGALPRAWVMVQDQTWGAPWRAAQFRWLALLLVGVAGVVLALRDAFVSLSQRQGRATSGR